MNIKIVSFGICVDILGNRMLEKVVEDGTTMIELKHKLLQSFPDLLKLKHFHIAINDEYATDTMVLKEGDEIALVPPVSGG